VPRFKFLSQIAFPLGVLSYAQATEQHMQRLDRITRDPAVMGGKACIRGMRVTVGMIVGTTPT